MRVGVTGANGYVGSSLACAFERRDVEVVRLGRANLPLDGRMEVERLEGLQALVHAAWDFRPRVAADYWRINADGSIRLLDAAAAAGVERLALVSTLSAFPGCPSTYGRAKLAVEEHALELGGIVVRPGLVWGAPGGSLYAQLAHLARSRRILPIFTGRRQRLHMAHEDDLGSFVAASVLDHWRPRQILAAAAPEPLTLASLLRRIAAADERRLHLARIPWRVAWVGLRALELAGLEPPFRSDSVVSLAGLDRDPFEQNGPPPGFRPFRP